METLEDQRWNAMVRAIAHREGNARELSARFEITTTQLREFAEDNLPAIEAERAHPMLRAPRPDVVEPTELDQLWISNKFQRLKRLQQIADTTYNGIESGMFAQAELAMAIREFRSYLMLAANELGQLLHRGSGDGSGGDSLSIDIQGVDMETMR